MVVPLFFGCSLDVGEEGILSDLEGRGGARCLIPMVEDGVSHGALEEGDGSDGRWGSDGR